MDSTYNFLARAEYQLLIELKQAEAVLSLPTLNIHFIQKLLHKRDDLRQSLFVGAVVRRVFENDA